MPAVPVTILMSGIGIIYIIGISMEQSPRIGIGLEYSPNRYRLIGIGICRILFCSNIQ